MEKIACVNHQIYLAMSGGPQSLFKIGEEIRPTPANCDARPFWHIKAQMCVGQ
jgi:hypothetical protein